MLKQMLMGVAMMGATFVFATEGVAEMAVQLFGKEDAAKQVEKGAVFIDGLFVKAPYSVSREGNVILVNGMIASRFKVESKTAEKNASDAATAAEDEGKGGEIVSDEDGASIGSEDTPELDVGDDAPETGKKTSAIEARLAKKGGGIESRLAEKKRKAELAKKSESGTFNSSALSEDPTALFEEADYTYTPPKRPDPAPVPYIRPAAAKSMSERMAEAKARDAAATQPKEADEGDDAIATEDFDNLTEAEIAEFKATFEKRREVIEKALSGDSLVLMTSTTSAAKVVRPATMKSFIVSLPSLCKGSNSGKLVQKWRKEIPAAYLKRIYNNREANLPAIKSLESRIKRDAKSRKN